MEFVRLDKDNGSGIAEMSRMATAIVREHFDPIIGKAQNDYMINKFQTEEAIREQLTAGYQYYFCVRDDITAGFLAFYPKNDYMYLSKFYLYREYRGLGYSHEMLEFVKNHCHKASIHRIELNVNRNNSAIFAYESLGFRISREEKNDIGHGFYMDDYVYSIEV